MEPLAAQHDNEYGVFHWISVISRLVEFFDGTTDWVMD